MKASIITCFLFAWFFSASQDVPIKGQKRIFFPYPMDTSWRVSIGFTTTTLPREITEELHFRVPAGDLHAIRRISKNFYLDSRLSFQFLQNLITVGPRFSTPINERLSIALGNDVGFWFGFVNAQGLKTRGTGWQNYPNLSFGYRFNKGILLTLRGESIMNFGVKTFAGKTPVTSDYRLFSGSAFSLILEQPFTGRQSMTLGFRALYTDYHWQTWTLFENYDKNLFFPQLTVGLIL